MNMVVRTNKKTVNGLRWGSKIPCAMLLMAVSWIAACDRAVPNDRGAELAGRWLAALNSHQASAVMALMDPQGTFEDPTSDGPVDVAKLDPFWSNVWRLFPDLSFTASRVVAQDNRVVIEWQASGRHMGREPVTFSGAHSLELRGDRILHARAYFDASVYLPFLSAAGS